MNRRKTADQALVRELNTALVMEQIRRHAPLSRAELAARTGLNRSTITLIINDLIDQGFVHETDRQDPTVGRPGVLLQFDPQGGSAVGVEIGVDFIAVILTNFAAETVWQQRVPLTPGLGQVAMMEKSEALIDQALRIGRQHALQPLGIGVGIPGLVDAQQGKLVYAPNLKWTDVPVRLMWMSRFNLPVFVENEANCAALGEYYYGAAHDVQDFVYLETGVGLGGGIMIDGQLFKGATGFAGEIGHISLYSGGEPCGCGRRGCWETYVSPQALRRSLVRQLQAGAASLLEAQIQGDFSKITMELIQAAAQGGDPPALSALEELGVHLGVGISNLVNIFNPELVVLGGVLSLFSPWLLPVIEAALQRDVLPPLRRDIRVCASQKGLEACVHGAAALVLEDIFR